MEWEASITAGLQARDPYACAGCISELSAATFEEARCCKVLRLCASEQQSGVAVALVQKIHESSLPTSNALFLQALRACAKAADLPRMWSLLELRKELRVPLDSRIFEYCFQCCRHARDSPAADRLWDLMRESGLWPGEAGLQHLASVHSAAGNWERAREVLMQAAAAGQPTSSFQWTSVITGAVRAKDIPSAEQLLNDMPVEPTVNNYNALLHGYAMLWTSRMSEDERIVAAEELLRRMHARGLAPSRATFNCLLALHRYNMPRVRELLEQMQTSGIEPDLKSYTKATQTFLFSKRCEEVEDLIRKMKAAGLAPDARFYEVAIRAAQSVGLLDYADQLYRRSSLEGVQVS
ncbi:MAG: hypothetical protein SGPRY_012259 [Prymnesium sp.]